MNGSKNPIEHCTNATILYRDKTNIQWLKKDKVNNLLLYNNFEYFKSILAINALRQINNVLCSFLKTLPDILPACV